MDKFLIGSNKFPSMVVLDGVKETLGYLVQKAFTRSELSIEQWNALDETARDKLIEAVEQT